MNIGFLCVIYDSIPLVAGQVVVNHQRIYILITIVILLSNPLATRTFRHLDFRTYICATTIGNVETI